MGFLVEDRTYYHYDYEDPATYGSDNNRLMWSELTHFDFFGSSVSSTTESFAEGIETPADLAAASGVDVLDRSTWPAEFESMTTMEVAEQFASEVTISKTWYYYNLGGNVTHVVTNLAGTTAYTASRMGYARNERTVTHAIGESWTWTGTGNPSGYTVTYAREFRYDRGRQRYLSRELSPTNISFVLSETWSDYDGDSIYGDFTVNGQGNAVENRSFEPGIATVHPWRKTGDAKTKYYHADHLGTTRHLTNANGNDLEPASYSAFGGDVSGTDHRYGYAGSFSYQTDASGSFPFLHVGARYYDPDSGRFLQRDPIGIADGTNVYTYVRNNPTRWIDSDGMQRHTKRDAKTGRFKKKPWWRRGKKAGLVLVCLDLAERHLIPKLDKWIEDNYKDNMDRINDTPSPPPPTNNDGGDEPPADVVGPMG